MNNYWYSYYTDLVSVYADCPMKQTGKTVNGTEVGEDQITLIVENVSKMLELSSTDILFDLCCGNGLLTVRFAKYVGSATGIDFTEKLLAVACEQHGRSNLRYQLANILTLSPHELAAASCCTMYEALQHFTPSQFGQLLHTLSQQPAGDRFFVGGIPDQRRLLNFYNTEEKFRFYKNCEQGGRPHLGRWWLEEEIHELAAHAGYTVTILEQPAKLYTAYYRFDALLKKRR